MRPFNLYDLSTFYNYRNQVISLDCALDLTRGNSMMGVSLLIDQLDPDREVFLVVNDDDEHYKKKLIGQISISSANRKAHLDLLMPKPLGGTSAMGDVIKELCHQATNRGALNVLAEVEVGEAVFSTLQKQGFRVYDRLRIWSLQPRLDFHRSRRSGWEVSEEINHTAIQHLNYSLIPPLAQAAQSENYETRKGLVYWQGGEILGFLESVVGLQGIYLKPLLHPAVENVAAVLYDAIHQFVPLLGRPVYIALPSYMGWIESTLYELDAEVISLRTLMVRYLAQPLRVKETEALLRPLERARVHPTHFEQ